MRRHADRDPPDTQDAPDLVDWADWLGKQRTTLPEVEIREVIEQKERKRARVVVHRPCASVDVRAASDRGLRAVTGPDGVIRFSAEWTQKGADE